MYKIISISSILSFDILEELNCYLRTECRFQDVLLNTFILEGFDLGTDFILVINLNTKVNIIKDMIIYELRASIDQTITSTLNIAFEHVRIQNIQNILSV